MIYADKYENEKHHVVIRQQYDNSWRWFIFHTFTGTEICHSAEIYSSYANAREAIRAFVTIADNGLIDISRL